jgi:hypothetical protein
MLRAFLLWSTILAVAACENTPTEPVEGRFELLSVNGSSIPATTVFRNLSVTVDSGHVVLHDDETFDRFLAFTVHEFAGGDTPHFENVEGGWVRSGNEVQFLDPNGVQTFTGLIDGGELEIQEGGALFVHRR